MVNAQVVQTGCHFYEAIRTVRMRIAQSVFHATRTLDARNGMLDTHADTRQGAIVPFLAWGQRAPARFFFGWKVRATAGSYP